MKLRDRIKHEYSNSILSSKLTVEVTDRVSEQDMATAINTNVKRMWARFYWDTYEQVGAAIKSMDKLADHSGAEELYNILTDLLRTIEQYRE